MKKIFTLILIMTVAFTNANAQTTYTVSTDKGWNGNYPSSYCNTCTFNISAGKTLTIDKSGVTCYQCTFNGGKISIGQDFTCQSCTFNSDSITMNNKTLSLQSNNTTFSGVYFKATGSSTVSGNAPITMLNSTFIFDNNAYFNPTWPLDMTNSNIYLWGNAGMMATGTPINLKNNSHIVIGDGSLASKAYFYVNGPVLNIYDASSIKIANKNNYYRNWAAYNYYPSTASSAHVSYTTTNNNLNCGGSNPNACSASYVYGGSTLSATGLLNVVTLPVKLTDFSVRLDNNYQVKLSWTTEQEVNFDKYIIEKSTDGTVWQSIGTVNGKSVLAGSAYYDFTDATPAKGSNYYRLNMVDKDGSSTYSRIVSVKVSAVERTTLFPNPVINSTFSVRVPSADATIVKVFTSQGQLLSTNSLNGQLQYQVKLPASAPTGNLVIQVINNGQTNSFNVLNK